MKKTIIILGAMLISFCTYGQENERLRNHQMPEKAERLFKYAELLGCSRYEQYYNSDDIFIKKIILSRTLRPGEKRTLLLDSIRRTFIGLNDLGARESYMFETHHDSIDSIVYRIHFDEGKKFKRMAGKHPKTGKLYYGISDYDIRALNFRYSPTLRDNLGDLGHAVLIYEYRDSIMKSPSEPLNTKEYWKIVKKVFKQNGTKGQSYYLYNDSTLHNHNLDVGDGTLSPPYRIIEQKGFVYEIDTKEHLEEIMHDLVQETWEYLDQHPLVKYDIFPTTINPDLNFNFIRLYIEHTNTVRKDFAIDVVHYHQPDHFWLVAREIDGDDFFPIDWETLKSYKNGEKVYHKK